MKSKLVKDIQKNTKCLLNRITKKIGEYLMEKEEYNDQVEGRNAVLELLESGRDINKILVANGEKHGSIHKILAIAKERKIIVTELN